MSGDLAVCTLVISAFALFILWGRTSGGRAALTRTLGTPASPKPSPTPIRKKPSAKSPAKSAAPRPPAKPRATSAPKTKSAPRAK